MSDTTETASLRDLMGDVIYQLDNRFGPGPDEIADRVLDLLRAHRDETLTALGATELRAQPHKSYVLADDEYHDRVHEADADCDSDYEPCLPVWVFREVSE